MIFEVDLAAINSFEYESTWIADPHHTLLAYRKGKRYVIVICLKGVPSQPAIKGMPNGHGLPVHSVVCENFRHFSEAWHLFSSACPLVQYPEEMRRSAVPDVKPTNIVEFRPPGQLSCQQTQIAALEARAAHARANWAKGDREHFLNGMPRAANPRAGKPAEKVVPSEEPKWWADFVGECYPNARKMTYGQIAARLPDVIAEGHRWAASRGSV